MAGCQPTLENGALHLLADLAVQWRVRRGIEDETQRGCFTDGARHNWYSLDCRNWLFRLHLIAPKVRPAIN